jgi:hypothetical protein
VYSLKIVYMSTYKNKQKCTQLKSFPLHFWPRNLKTDHLCEFNFIALLKFGKYEITNKKHFSVTFLVVWVMDVLHTTHLVWTGKSGVQGSSRSLVRSTVVFASLRVVSWIAMILPVGLQTHTRVHRTHNSTFYKFA